MNRPRSIVLAPFALVAAGCLGVVDPDSGGVVGVSEPLGVGTPCTPTIEDDPSFPSFTEAEVAIEEKSPSCSTGVCLVNHFRGRVSCAYGGLSKGACTTPKGVPLETPGDVEPQCADRRAKDAVYCSCRCANAEGRTDDGGSYCACPTDYACKHLVDPFPGHGGLAGSYCVKAAVPATASSACRSTCSPDDPTRACE